jgi:hypothetical protein
LSPKHVGILPAIADLLGIRKLLGFAAVNALKFCSFCDLEHNKLSVIDEVVGHPRIGEDVRQAGRAYLDAPIIEKQNKLFKASGVRFSTVQQLSYRDPVHHTVLGMMYNWLDFFNTMLVSNGELEMSPQRVKRLSSRLKMLMKNKMKQDRTQIPL